MTPSVRRMIDTACLLAVAGLFAMTWSVLDPRPVPVFFAMSLGQVIGTMSFVLLIVALMLGLTTRNPGRAAGTGEGT